ncbi:MAG: cell division ATP-binding protein FtsE [Firmicutes bacterium]|nr:cell division ATP-binding protein FtsE [Bacillota bacterium]
MIEAREIYHRYDQNGGDVLSDINFMIDRGEFVFFVGPSGAGKTTLFKMIIQEIVPRRGLLKVFGQDLTRLPRYRVPYLRRSIGMVFQDFRLLEERTAFDNIAFAMRVTGASNREIRRQVPYVLELVGLPEKAGARVCDLSGGEQQRIGLARAIINRPAMIIADEPTGNLDPDTSYEIMNILRTINIRGTTVLVATHNREIVDRLQKRVIHLEGGRLTVDEEKGAYAGVR